MVCSGHLCLLCRLRRQAVVLQEWVLQTVAGRGPTDRVYLEHELEQVFEGCVLLAPLVIDYIVEQKHVRHGYSTRLSRGSCRPSQAHFLVADVLLFFLGASAVQLTLDLFIATSLGHSEGY